MIALSDSVLLWLVTFPLVGAVLCLLFSDSFAKWLAFGFSIVGVVLAAIVYEAFDPSGGQHQMLYVVPWIQSLNIHFSLGLDGLSLPMVALTKGMLPIAILASWEETRRPKAFMAAFLVLDSAMTGTFLATDIFLFYVFWEIMLLPMLLLIGVWGSKDRIYASLKFFLYTFAGSLLMLVSIFWIFSTHYDIHQFYTGDIRSFYDLTFSPAPVFLGLGAQELVFLGFFVAFAIKVPLFPFHTWLPDAHVQAPTGASILLAAVLLKMGAYGLIRFCIPITPEAFVRFTPLIVGLSLTGVLYGAWVAFQQTDLKKLVAYSSVSHLGFVVLGICALNAEALNGAILQMVNHGLSTGALFLLVGILYERRHTRELTEFGGLASQMPWFAICLTFVACSSMGVPGLNGFVGEFLILLGTFQENPVWGGLATLGILFGAIYLLSMLGKVLFGPITKHENRQLKDLNSRESCALIPLCFLILFLGVYPGPLMSKFAPAVQAVLQSPAARAKHDKGQDNGTPTALGTETPKPEVTSL